MKEKYYLFMLLFSMNCLTTFGQGLDESPAGVMISHCHPKGGWMVSYTYMSNLMRDNLIGNSKIDDGDIFKKDYAMSPHSMNMDMHMLMGMYGLTGRITVMAMTSYNKMSMDMMMFAPTMIMNGKEMSMSDSQMHTKSSGIGDTKLYGIFKLLNAESSTLVLNAGINIPTGSIDLNGGSDLANQRLPYMMQLGSGSWDLLPGITFLKSGKLSWSAQLLGVLRPFYNANNYHLGNELTANAWAAYQLKSFVSVSLRLEGFTSDAIQGQDIMIYNLMEPDANPNNYGGQRLNGYAGVNFYINKGALRDSKFGIEFGSPLYQNLNGPQMEMQSVLNAGFTKSF